MGSKRKTKGDLLEELEASRHKIAELELPELDRGRAWEKLRQSEERYRMAVDSVHDAIVINVGTTRVFVNHAFLTLHGLDDMSQAHQVPLDHFIVPEDKPMVAHHSLARQNGQPAPGRYEYRIQRPNGDIRTVETSAVAIDYEGRNATLAVLRDITDRKQAEQRDLDRGRRLAEISRIISSTPNVEQVYEPFAEIVRQLIPFERIVITIADPDHRTLTTSYVSGSDIAYRRPGDVAELANSLTQEVMRTRSGLLIQTEDPEEFGRRFTAPLPVFEAGFRSFLSVPLVAQDQVIGALHLESTKPEAYTQQDLNLAESVGVQISGAIANARLFEQLEVERERLRWLTRQVVAQEEEERHRVSRELHDEAGQALTALKISLSLIQSEMPLATGEESGQLNHRLADAVDLTDTTMEKIRLLARGLRPPELDAVGLNGTLGGYCSEFGRRTDLPIQYTGVEIPNLTDAVNISFYRVLQEALTNAAKHARASSVKVKLSRRRRMVRLSVEDNGQGFNPRAQMRQAKSNDFPQSGGIGLLGMQERFELLGGRLDVKSRLGMGTRLVAQAPTEES